MSTRQLTNVVILVNDQHAHDALGCAGYGPLKTPVVDRLAADGVRFTQSTCACTPCLPSRHNLFHGLYSLQTGIYTNSHRMLPEDIPEFTMGKIFSMAGYETASCGKMHWFPYHAPVERDRYFGFGYRAGHFYETGEKMDTHFTAAHRNWREALTAEHKAHGISKGGDSCAADYVGFDSALPLSKYSDWFSAERAAEFIDKNAHKPFLAVCSLNYPHAPHVPAADYAGMYDPETVPLPPEEPEGLTDAEDYHKFDGLDRDGLKMVIARYMAGISQADACHAQVLDALDRNGLYDESLIIFLSDHGELLGSRGTSAFSKYNLYDQSIRVPLIIKPPKSMNAQAGITCDSLVSLVDILPTVMSVAGIEGCHRLPGIALAPHLRGEKPERDVALTEYVAKGNKLFTAIRGRKWKLILGQHGEELYHIANDPYEFENLVSEPGSADIIATLKSHLLSEYQRIFRSNAEDARSFEHQEWSVMMDR